MCVVQIGTGHSRSTQFSWIPHTSAAAFTILMTVNQAAHLRGVGGGCPPVATDELVNLPQDGTGR
jgi:hypothetical protein